MNNENQENVMTIAEDFVESSGEMLCCNSSEACGSCNTGSNSSNNGCWTDNTCSCGGSCEECCGSCGEDFAVHIFRQGRNYTKLMMKKSDGSILLTARFFPLGVAPRSLIWESSDRNIISVQQDDEKDTWAYINPRRDGRAIISLKTRDDDIVRDTIEIIVESHERVEVENKGEYFTVTFTERANNVARVWKSVCFDLSQQAAAVPPAILNRAHENQNFDFDEEQLGFLYLLDPLGVEYYMRNYSHGGDVYETLIRKILFSRQSMVVSQDCF